MKCTRLSHLLLCVFVVFVSLSGCRSVPSGVVDDAARALGQADEALKLAQQHADEASRATTLQKYLDEVAAAKRAAQEAQSYANQVDDPSLVRKVEEVSTTSTSLLNRFFYQAHVDEISRKIMGMSDLPTLDQDTENLLKEILNVTFCYTITNEYVGQFPSEEQIRYEMLARADQRKFNLANFEVSLSQSIESEAYGLLASLQKKEDLQNYKDACEELLDLF